MIERKVTNLMKNRAAVNKKEANCCSICGKIGAEKRILSAQKSTEYVVKGARKPSTTRGAELVCDQCFSKIIRDRHFACELTEDNKVIEYR